MGWSTGWGRAYRGERAAVACLGGLCTLGALGDAGCQKDPVVATRTVTLHAPQGCAAGLANLDGSDFGTYRELGDFEAPAPAGGYSLGPSGVALAGIDPAARALLVAAANRDNRPWQGVGGVGGTGAVDVLLLPLLTSCALRGAVSERSAPAMAPIGGGRVLLVGGAIAAAAATTPTLELRLDTGALTAATVGLLTPRNFAAVTAFGSDALVAGGIDSRDGATVLDRAEIYDSARHAFDRDHIVELSTARSAAGAAVLVTGETLLVGGVGSDGKTALASMELVDPATRTVRSENVARLTAARSAPAVLRLTSGEILVAGGLDSSGNAVPTLEWFSADASQATKRPQTLVTGSARTYVALEGGGALAVIAPPANADATFQNTWLIDPEGGLDPATPVAGSLTQPVLFGGAGGAPVLWTGDRWLRWQPWLGAFGSLDVLDEAPAHVGASAASPDPGLALWLDTTAGAPRLNALRFDVRGDYSPLAGALLIADTTDMAPDRLATHGSMAFDPSLTGGVLTLDPGASAFIVDRTYADVRVELDAPTGAPALLVLRDPLGHELEVGGASCFGSVVTGAPSSLVVERRGAKVQWTVSGSAPSNVCRGTVGAEARLSIGVRGAPDLGRSVVRNLRVTRLGTH